MSEIKAKLLDDIKQAMRDKNKEQLTMLRGLSAAIKQVEIDKQIDAITDDQVINVIMSMIKQRKESAKQYRAADRQDLAEKEEAENEVYSNYLPEQLTPEEIAALISSAIAETGAESVKDMAKVMDILKPQLAGKADISEVGNQIREQLNA